MRTSLSSSRHPGATARGNAWTLSLPAIAPPMTRCECAGVTFAEIGRMLEAGEPLPAALARTGCAGMCAACGPDLEAFLASRPAHD